VGHCGFGLGPVWSTPVKHPNPAKKNQRPQPVSSQQLSQQASPLVTVGSKLRAPVPPEGIPPATTPVDDSHCATTVVDAVRIVDVVVVVVVVVDVSVMVSVLVPVTVVVTLACDDVTVVDVSVSVRVTVFSLEVVSVRVLGVTIREQAEEICCVGNGSHGGRSLRLISSPGGAV
jgi:hypothetical protein